MAQSLRARLQRIRESRARPAASPGAAQTPLPGGTAACVPRGFPAEWVPAGSLTLKRAVTLPCAFPRAFSPRLAALVPDIAGTPAPSPEALVFFDLETTGLSGGAGTLAFLAAFGAVFPERSALRVTQYLLLDYPGEGAFLRVVLGELARAPFAVSYNGKAFDAQILRSRCLVNGARPPAFRHCDLLHPARRLWKKTLPRCSQAAVETLLGLDRAGDLSGAFAPDMWFGFLRTGAAAGLLKVCEHNLRDIRGLAALLAALNDIAASPLEAAARWRCDSEALALRLHEAAAQYAAREAEREAVWELLARAAEAGSPRACRALAVRAEWRLGDRAAALAWTEKALASGVPSPRLARDLHHRRERLVKKREWGTGSGGSGKMGNRKWEMEG